MDTTLRNSRPDIELRMGLIAERGVTPLSIVKALDVIKERSAGTQGSSKFEPRIVNQTEVPYNWRKKLRFHLARHVTSATYLRTVSGSEGDDTS